MKFSTCRFAVTTLSFHPYNITLVQVPTIILEKPSLNVGTKSKERSKAKGKVVAQSPVADSEEISEDDVTENSLAATVRLQASQRQIKENQKAFRRMPKRHVGRSYIMRSANDSQYCKVHPSCSRCAGFAVPFVCYIVPGATSCIKCAGDRQACSLRGGEPSKKRPRIVEDSESQEDEQSPQGKKCTIMRALVNSHATIDPKPKPLQTTTKLSQSSVTGSRSHQGKWQYRRY